MRFSKTFFTLALLTSSLLSFAQDAGTNAVTIQPQIPEEARKHFVMGETMFKDAKTPDDYTQVVSEFKQAADLAPRWPDPRYDLALAEEAAGNYSGAEADLKLYQQFKLSDDEARTVQDKIYVIEAKQEEAAKKQAEKKESDAKDKIYQKFVDLQMNFPGLIQKLNGAVFVDKYSGQGSFCFIKKPFNLDDGTSFIETPFLLMQPYDEKRHYLPQIIIPTSSSRFWGTEETWATEEGIDKTNSNSNFNQLQYELDTYYKGPWTENAENGYESMWKKYTLSEDGNTLTETRRDGKTYYYLRQ